MKKSQNSAREYVEHYIVHLIVVLFILCIKLVDQLGPANSQMCLTKKSGVGSGFYL